MIRRNLKLAILSITMGFVQDRSFAPPRTRFNLAGNGPVYISRSYAVGLGYPRHADVGIPMYAIIGFVIWCWIAECLSFVSYFCAGGTSANRIRTFDK